MATASTDVQIAIKCMKTGACDYITKPFELDKVVHIIRRALRERELVIENRNYKQSLEVRVRYQARKLNAAYLNSIKSLAQALEAKDRYTKGHSLRVSRLAVAIAEEMGLPQERIDNLKIAGLVHDIGKIGVSEFVLNKPAGLTDGEFNQVKKHCEIGARILKPLGGDDEIIAVVRSHHESYDGNGYPDGLQAGEIPLGARILAVADSYDAMTSERPYRPPVSAGEAADEIERHSDTKFDTDVVAAFFRVLEKSAELLCDSVST
jgi:putative nucleotidyltransferase with HDIG domain